MQLSEFHSTFTGAQALGPTTAMTYSRLPVAIPQHTAHPQGSPLSVLEIGDILVPPHRIPLN